MVDAGKQNRGGLSAAFIGYFGVIAAVITGSSRDLVVFFATVSFVSYLLSTTNLFRFVRNSVLVWYSRTHYHCNIGHVDRIAPPGPTDVNVQIYKGSRKIQGNEAAAKAVMALPNLRCEFKVKKGGTFLATDLRLTNNFLITAKVPEMILTEMDGRKRLCNGPYIMRWKCDGRRRALVRRWVGFDKTGYQQHLWRRRYNSWLEFKEKLKDESSWPKE